jgi:acetyl esterase/lipase
MTRFAAVTVSITLLFSACASQNIAPTPTTVAPAQYFLPTTISPESHATLERLIPAVQKSRAERGVPRTAEDFAQRNVETETRAAATNAQLLPQIGVTATDSSIGGVPVVMIEPAHDAHPHTILIFVHGGAWVGGSARSTLGMPARVAHALERRIVSIDYTLAPKARWPEITNQIVTVYQALLAQGYAAKRIGMFGDSAGGNLVATSTLKLRDQGLPLPAAIVLLSPGTDLTQSSDTFTTLKGADPALGPEDLVAAISLYADAADWKNPYVSPVYGDFGKGYPPTLIQVGTKEMLLSDSVRLYQAIAGAGGEVVLDVYEGMPHVWQAYLNDAPEQKVAFVRMGAFFAKHVSTGARPSSRP